MKSKELKELEDLLEKMENKPEDQSEKMEKEYPKYDPAKNYRWEPETQFSFSGREFGIILNSLRTILGTREAQAILLAEKANNAIEEMMARAVEQGLVKESSQG